MRPPTQAFFLAAEVGQRFCLYHPPACDVALGAVVYVHPWAEEMNKSRRMAALQSRAFAEAGYAVLQIDLHGCGDSSGDFGDATWAGWIDDVRLAAGWLQVRHDAPLWLWGLRTGCLVAAQAAGAIDAPCNLLFWQPVLTGRSALQQFLRLRLASDLAGGLARSAMTELRERLSEGRHVEVAGYVLAPGLAADLEKASLDPSPRLPGLAWLEVSTRTKPALLPASLPVMEAWRSAGVPVRSTVVFGAAFWQTTEIEDAPALVAATVDALRAAAAP